MLYSVTPDIQKKETSNRYMGPGIHENTDLVSVEFKRTDKGNELLAFYFENDLKEKLSHTEWKVTLKKDLNNMTDKESKIYFSLVSNQIKRINAIVTTFITEEAFRQVKGDTFEQFALNTIKALGNSYKSLKVRIKVVYDKRNFTALPAYTNYDWIEPMTIPKEQSRIKILAKDKMAKSAPSYLEGADKVENEIQMDSKSTISNVDDLPF
jgi:hypothetical protein